MTRLDRRRFRIHDLCRMNKGRLNTEDSHAAKVIPAEYPRWFDEPKIVLLANGEKILLLDAVSGEYKPPYKKKRKPLWPF